MVMVTGPSSLTQSPDWVMRMAVFVQFNVYLPPFLQPIGLRPSRTVARPDLCVVYLTHCSVYNHILCNDRWLIWRCCHNFPPLHMASLYHRVATLIRFHNCHDAFDLYTIDTFDAHCFMFCNIYICAFDCGIHIYHSRIPMTIYNLHCPRPLYYMFALPASFVHLLGFINIFPLFFFITLCLVIYMHFIYNLFVICIFPSNIIRLYLL